MYEDGTHMYSMCKIRGVGPFGGDGGGLFRACAHGERASRVCFTILVALFLDQYFYTHRCFIHGQVAVWQPPICISCDCGRNLPCCELVVTRRAHAFCSSRCPRLNTV